MAGRVVMVKLNEMMSKQINSGFRDALFSDKHISNFRQFWEKKHVHAKTTDRPVVSWLSRALGSHPTKKRGEVENPQSRTNLFLYCIHGSVWVSLSHHLS
jgi:hypothetical protein